MKIEIDNTTLVIRFVCGFLFGLVIIGSLIFKATRHLNIDSEIWIFLWATGSFWFGYLAARYGDEFWYSFFDWGRRR